jgi:hypothetical protein
MHEWNQTPTHVTIGIPISYRIDAKKVDYTITENYVKLNIPDMKLIKMIDLFANVDCESSKMIIEDRKIVFYLKKENEDIWKELEYKSNGNKEMLRERRKLAVDNLDKKIQIERETAINKKKEFEKFVIDQSIKIDDNRRKELRDKKSVEKKEAEKELYEFVNKIEDEGIGERKDHLELDGKSKSEVRNKIEYEDDYADDYNSNKNSTSVIRTSYPQNKVIFSEKENLEKTQIRQPSNIKVNLTEKMIPHFAARESLSKEPPYPKSKKYAPEKNYVYIIYYIHKI